MYVNGERLAAAHATGPGRCVPAASRLLARRQTHVGPRPSAHGHPVPSRLHVRHGRTRGDRKGKPCPRRGGAHPSRGGGGRAHADHPQRRPMAGSCHCAAAAHRNGCLTPHRHRLRRTGTAASRRTATVFGAQVRDQFGPRRRRTAPVQGRFRLPGRQGIGCFLRRGELREGSHGREKGLTTQRPGLVGPTDLHRLRAGGYRAVRGTEDGEPRRSRRHGRRPPRRPTRHPAGSSGRPGEPVRTRAGPRTHAGADCADPWPPRHRPRGVTHPLRPRSRRCRPGCRVR